MNRAKQLTKLSGALTLLALCLVSADGSDAKIAFTSERDGNREVYTMNADGTDQTRLTFDPASDAVSGVSPDGTRILIESRRDGLEEVWVMNADGSGQTRLTNSTGVNAHAKFSPDGSMIVFTSTREGPAQIYVMNADGTGQTNITTSNPIGENTPAYSPDGTKIAFVSSRDGNFEIYIMNADGTGQTNLSNSTAEDGAPAFSPDGSTIAFWSRRNGNAEIYIMNVDGTNQTRVTNNLVYDCCPVFTPDGSRIVFHSGRDGNFEIYIMNVDGTAQTNLTNNPAAEFGPATPLFEAVLEIEVVIDIKPGSFPNSINLGSNGTVAVAIFSTETFDATEIDPVTVTLAGSSVRLRGRGMPQASFEDINGDGLLDLVVHVVTDALELTGEDVEAILEGRLYDGTLIRGSDTVRIVP
ncbi:MAG: PD40 domain-containing protein [Armatimonadetes bacterium]|nr:PD40 domain-containing protein [Armatimonadota bacterium]